MVNRKQSRNQEHLLSIASISMDLFRYIIARGRGGGRGLCQVGRRAGDLVLNTVFCASILVKPNIALLDLELGFRPLLSVGREAS